MRANRYPMLSCRISRGCGEGGRGLLITSCRFPDAEDFVISDFCGKSRFQSFCFHERTCPLAVWVIFAFKISDSAVMNRMTQ